MRDNIINYTEARSIILKRIKGKNLSAFCKENKIPYQQLMNLKGNPHVPYPSIAKKLLNAIGYTVVKVEKTTLYHLKDK